MNEEDPGPSRQSFRAILLLLLTLLAAAPLSAQDERGLSVSIDAGGLFADHYHADFYSGAPGNANTLLRVLHSQQYGPGIWEDLFSQGLITSAIGTYNQLQVAEYGSMRYRIAMQLGIGLRYDFGSHLAATLRFDYASLSATGQILLHSGRNNSTTLTNQQAYVTCPVMGQEKRILIDLGLSTRFPLREGFHLQADLGATAVNTKVEANQVLIAGSPYSILDIWEGQSPDAGQPGYDYQNQGGIGLGGYFTLGLTYQLPHGNSATLHYTLHYYRVNLPLYDLYRPQNLIGLRFELANFSFIK